MTQKVVIIFSGFNERAVIAFIRTLEQLHLRYTIIASSTDDSILSTKYRHKVSVIRKVRVLDIKDLTLSIEKAKASISASKYLIAPSTEALNRFLLEHRNNFEKQGCEVPLVDEVLYAKVSDKYTFTELCKQHSIRVPAEYDTLQDAILPCVAKPKRYISSNGNIYSPILIDNRNELASFRESFDWHDFFFQQFVGGESLYLLYYFYKDGTVAKFSQKNLMQQPGGKSVIAGVSSDFHNDQESGKYEKLFRSIGFSGLVMVEIKKQDSLHYMIEANPRFWGPSQLFVDAGVNLFESFLFDNDIISLQPNFAVSPKEIRYFWLGGMAGLPDGSKVAYHSYSKEMFESEHNDWMAAEVYNREDTKDLFKQEIKG